MLNVQTFIQSCCVQPCTNMLKFSAYQVQLCQGLGLLAQEDVLSCGCWRRRPPSLEWGSDGSVYRFFNFPVFSHTYTYCGNWYLLIQSFSGDLQGVSASSKHISVEVLKIKSSLFYFVQLPHHHLPFALKHFKKSLIY